jgi:hypothetical protein
MVYSMVQAFAPQTEVQDSASNVICLRVKEDLQVLHFDYFPTPAQAQTFRNQFRKIISSKRVKMTCGKPILSNGSWPYPTAYSTEDNGRFDSFVLDNGIHFESLKAILSYGLQVYSGRRESLIQYCHDSKSFLAVRSPKVDFNQVIFGNNDIAMSGFRLSPDLKAYQVSETGIEFSPALTFIQVNQSNGTVIVNDIPKCLDGSSLLHGLQSMFPNLEYSYFNNAESKAIYLEFDQKDLYPGVIMLYFGLDLGLPRRRILLNFDPLNPDLAYQINQVI